MTCTPLSCYAPSHVTDDLDDSIMDDQGNIAELLLEAIPLTSDGVALFDAQDRIIFSNTAWNELFAVPAQHSAGLTFSQLIEYGQQRRGGIAIQPNALQLWLEQMHKQRRSEPFRRFESKLWDGRWIMISEQLFNDGHMLCYCTDITKHKRLEQQLKTTTQQLQLLASKDDLTGLDNRRHFRLQASQEISRCHRHNTNAALLMLDIDHFKQVNDRFGHAAGDLVLSEFGKALKEFLRSYDLSGRMGGEEFAVLLPKTSMAHARLTAERLRQMSEALRVEYQGEVITVTVSIGVSTLEQHGTSLDDLYFVADKYLYLAKETGRNQVIAGQPSNPSS